MKRYIIVLMLILTLNTGTVGYAADRPLDVNEITSQIDNAPALKQMDKALIRLDNLHTRMKDVVDMIPTQLQQQITSMVLNAPVNVPVMIIGQTYTFDHVTDDSDVRQVLANFGFSQTNKARLDRDKAIYITPETIKMNYEVLKRKKDVTKESLKLGVEQLYNGILMAEKSLKLQEEVTSVSDAQLKNAQDRFEKGLISKNQLEIEKKNSTQSKLKLSKQKRSKQSLIYSLNKLLGLPISTNYTISEGEAKPLEMPDLNLEKYLEDALKNRVEMFEIGEDIKIKEKELFFTQIYYRSGEPEYDTTALKVEIAKEKLAQKKEDIKTEIENALEKIEQNSLDVEKAKLELESANNNYKLVQERFEGGLLTKDILDASHIAVTGAELKLLGAVTNYNLSVKKLKAAVSIGPEFK